MSAAAAPLVQLRAAGPIAPLRRAALWLSGLVGWRRYLAGFLFGVLAAAAMPPVDMTPVLLIAFPALVWLTDGSSNWRAAFALGWSFGTGFFLAGLYWIAAALFVDIAQFWWLVPMAVLGVPVGLAIFTGAALAVNHLLCRGFDLGGSPRILVLACCWLIAEWLRGHVLTGFPWNLMGYAWSGAFPGALALLQTTSLVGIYGLSLLTVVAAALPARLGDLVGPRWPSLAIAALLVAGPAAWGALRLAEPRPGTVPGVMLRLVQPSIPERVKADPASALANFQRTFALSTSAGADRVTAMLWAEDAAPPYLERDAAARMAVAAAAPPGGLVITGTVRTEPPPQTPVHVWNSLVAIDHDGVIRGTYDKAHLVPFGEYVPLRAILPMRKITPGMIDFSPGPGPRTLFLPGLPPVGPLICYEAIFPGAVIDAAHRPDWMLNITNDAWYGFTSGPFQHLAIARTRSVEEGLPLVRVGGNGISAVIDPYGRVLQRLNLDAVGILDSPLPKPLLATIYSVWGDLPFGTAVGLILLFTVIGPRSRKRPRRFSP